MEVHLASSMRLKLSLLAQSAGCVGYLAYATALPKWDESGVKRTRPEGKEKYS